MNSAPDSERDRWKQETQLSLTNRATRLEVSQELNKLGTVPYIRHGFLLVW